MMRSLFSAVSGLRNHQTRMDVIGNDIANVNTTGYKASRVNFSDVLSQTIQGATAPQGNRGGVNPMQVGLGMTVASIDTIFTDGSTQPTGVNTDLAISGNGFFTLQDATGGQIFTRAGNFNFDAQGYLVQAGTGLKVMGYPAVAGVVGTTLGPLTAPIGSPMAPSATTKATFTQNLSSDNAIGATTTKDVDVYDANGIAHTVTFTFTKATATTWTAVPSSTEVPNPITGAPSWTVTFNANGTYNTVAGPASFTVTGSTGATATVTPSFSGLTQYSATTKDAAGNNVPVNTLYADSDGWTTGALKDRTIDTNGNIIGSYDNGHTQILGQVALATFVNPGGLTKVGSTSYAQSNNSGTASIDVAGTGGRGSFVPGSLEMSNVDLSQEFSNMIITERGFQANSKIITTSDEMLQDLTNLKR